MILSGIEIERRLNKQIFIELVEPAQLNPNSDNLRLHNELMMYDESVLDMKKENRATQFTIPEEGYTLKPGKLYLGRTLEYTKTNDFVPRLEGRSSIGRLVWECLSA